MNNKAVILGSNYYIGLSIIRCLGSKGIYTVAVDYSKENCYAAKSKYLKEHLIAPHYKEKEEEYLKFLIDYAKKQGDKPVLFPSADPYVDFIDKHLIELKKYYLINMTEPGLWNSVMDKQALHTLAVKHKVLVPETITTSEENYLDRVEKEISYPCIVKPTDSPAFMSIFRTKMFKCFARDDVVAAVKRAKDENLEVIIQRIIPGFDDHMYTFDAYLNQESKVTHWMTCQKQRQYPINFGASVYTQQKYVQELSDIGIPFMEAIGYKGFGEIEFKKDEKNGKFYFIEINARTTTLNSMLDKCGINFPLLAYTELTGGHIGSKNIKDDIGITWRYLFEDMLAIRDYIKAKQLTRKRILKSLLVKKAPAIWAINDPAPALDFMVILLKKACKKVMRK